MKMFATFDSHAQLDSYKLHTPYFAGVFSGVLLKSGTGRDRDGTSHPVPLLKYGTKLRMHTLIWVDKHLKCGSRPLRKVLEA